MFSLFSFQELDLSAETLLKNVTPKEDEWLKIAEQGLHPKAQYTKVMAKVLFEGALPCLFCFDVKKLQNYVYRHHRETQQQC